jgi:hypothetical protein
MQVKLPLVLAGAVSALALTLAPTAALAHDGHGGDGDHGGHGDHGGNGGNGDHGDHGDDNLVRADLVPSMPTDAAIDGVAPGGLPWQLSRGEVRVRQNGRVDVRIEGLQIPRNGSADNPVPAVDAVLYCGGVAAADSGAQPLTVPDGDARFRVFLSVPSRCDQATVLISPSTAVGKAYIASAVGSGHEGHGDGR